MVPADDDAKIVLNGCEDVYSLCQLWAWAIYRELDGSGSQYSGDWKSFDRVEWWVRCRPDRCRDV